MQTKDPNQTNGAGPAQDHAKAAGPATEEAPVPEKAPDVLDPLLEQYQSLSEDLVFDRDVNRRRRARHKKRRQQQQALLLGVLAVSVVAIFLLLTRCGGKRNGSAAISPSPSASGGWASLWAVLPAPSSSPSAEPGASPSPSAGQTGAYDFSQPVPEGSPVEDSYFADAVFIGDSRTQGFFLYSGLTGSTSYASQGMNVNTVFTGQTVPQADGTKISVVDALRKNPNFNKVYIMLGLNELGWVNLDIFQQQYEKLIDTVRDVKPDAIVYVQSLLPVSAQKDASSSTHNNTRVALFNDRVKAAALSKKAFFVNVAEAVQDENGYLPASVTFDGVHLQKVACQQWLSYLKTHTVPAETAAQNQVSPNPIQSSAPAQSTQPAQSTTPSESAAPSESVAGAAA